jgi:hypothetical protein
MSEPIEVTLPVAPALVTFFVIFAMGFCVGLLV